MLETPCVDSGGLGRYSDGVSVVPINDEAKQRAQKIELANVGETSRRTSRDGEYSCYNIGHRKGVLGIHHNVKSRKSAAGFRRNEAGHGGIRSGC